MNIVRQLYNNIASSRLFDIVRQLYNNLVSFRLFDIIRHRQLYNNKQSICTQEARTSKNCTKNCTIKKSTIKKLYNNDHIIRICTQEACTKALLLQWLCDNKIQYSFNKDVHKSESDYYGRDRRCCFCPKLATYVLYNGYHRKNSYCNTYHSLYSNSYTTSMICEQCYTYALDIVHDQRKLVLSAIKMLSVFIPQDVIDIITSYFHQVTKHSRSLMRMLDL